VIHPRIVGNDVSKLFSLAKRSYHLASSSLQHSHDFSSVRRFSLGKAALGFYIEANENTVFVHRRSCVASRDCDFGHGRVIRHQEAPSAFRDLDPSRNQVGFFRQDVAVPFDSRDKSVAFEIGKNAAQFLFLAWV